MLRSLCFTLAIVNDGAMDIVLADSALFVGQQDPKLRLYESAQALEHYTASLKSVSTQLSSVTNDTFNEIISMVTFLAAYDVSQTPFQL